VSYVILIILKLPADVFHFVSVLIQLVFSSAISQSKIEIDHDCLLSNPALLNIKLHSLNSVVKQIN